METPCPEEKDHISYRSSFNFMVERENRLKNQAAFQQTLERLHKVVNQIYDLQQEIAFRKADLRALQVKLGGIAVKYGLEPVGPTPVEAENTIPAKAPFSVTS